MAARRLSCMVELPPFVEDAAGACHGAAGEVGRGERAVSGGVPDRRDGDRARDRGGLQDLLAGSDRVFLVPEPNRRLRRALRGAPFRPTPPLPSRTHVPHADDTPATHTLARRAGARGRRHGTRVRDAGRGNPRPRGTAGPGSPAGSRIARAVHRPHLRAPAPPPADSSAACAQERLRPSAHPGLHHAGLPAGARAGLTRTALRSGRTGAPRISNASRAAAGSGGPSAVAQGCAIVPRARGSLASPGRDERRTATG